MNIERPINVLVRRRAAIGDVIMSTGVVREIKLQYGNNCNLDVATECLEVYRNNPHVRNIFHTNGMPDASTYDVYINLDDAYELNPLNHYLDSYFYRAFGRTDLNQNPELFASAEDQEHVAKDLEQIGDKFITVHMRNWHWPAKNISMDIWLDVFTRLFEQRTDFKVVTVGGPTDFYIEEHPLFYDTRGRYNVQQHKLLMDSASSFVGIDSGPYWCAAASKTKIIALLTHLKAERIVPIGNESVATLEDCHGCNDQQARPVRHLNCIKGNYPCASNFNAQEIADKILKTLE